MKGTEKQITWAAEIKQDVVAGWDKYIHLVVEGCGSEFADYAASPPIDEWDDRALAIVVARHAAAVNVVAWLDAQDDAGWWIDNRDDIHVGSYEAPDEISLINALGKLCRLGLTGARPTGNKT